MPAYRWFTTYTGSNWRPERGYNELFAEQVRLLREWFGLQKDKLGREKSSGVWREYTLQGKAVLVTVDSLTWSEYRTVGRGGEEKLSYGTTTPVFRLKVRIAHARGGKNQGSFPTAFFDETLVIEFPWDYPKSPPMFRVDKVRFRFQGGGAHEHHMYGGGWMCILGFSNDWREDRDTIISAIAVALDWIVWHHGKFGW